MGRRPTVRQEVEQIRRVRGKVGGMVLLGIGQFPQHILQVIFNHQVVPMGTAHHTNHLHSARCRIGVAKEQPVAAANGQRPNDPFRLVVVDRNVSVAEVSPQHRPLIPQVAERFADRAAGHPPSGRVASQPLRHAVPDRHGVALTQVATRGGVQRLCAFFNVVQLLVERDALRCQNRVVRSALTNSRRGCALQLAWTIRPPISLLQSYVGPAGVAHERAAIRRQVTVDHAVLMQQRPVKHVVGAKPSKPVKSRQI